MAEISGKAAAFLAALLWPEICPFCGKASRQGICPACRKAVDRLVIREPRCMQCGRPVRSPEQEYCRDCMEVRRSFDQGVSLWLHKKPVPWSVYQFKYHNQRPCGQRGPCKNPGYDRPETAGKAGPEKKYHRCIYCFKKLPAGPDRTSRRRYLHDWKYHGCSRKSTPCGGRSKSLLFNDKYWTRIRIFVILKMMFRSQ